MQIFEALNSKLHILIDDYEDEVIPFEKLPQAIQLIEQYVTKRSGVVEEILNLTRLALERETALYFYF